MSTILAGEAELGPAEFKAFAAILYAEARIVLSEAKATLVRSRLARRLRHHGLASFSDYLRFVREDAEERSAMVTALTTNHTHFFREVHHFDHFLREVLPQLKARAGKRPVRLWSAGCSTGEEVYSLAMCMLGTDPASATWLKGTDVKLLATDISPPVVEATRQGVYAVGSDEAVPGPCRKLWMHETPQGLQMAPEARALVTARILNLFGPWPMRRRFDVIFCRNVMIYFDDQAKRELELRLVEQLEPGGTLYIGHSERLLGEAERRMVSCGHTIYRKPGELP